MNCNPTDKDILELAGNILKLLDADNLAKGVKDQYDALGEEFDPNDTETLESIRQANIYLGNLLTSLPDDEDDNLLQDNEKVICTLEKIFKKDMPINFLASVLLLIARMAN